LNIVTKYGRYVTKLVEQNTLIVGCQDWTIFYKTFKIVKEQLKSKTKISFAELLCTELKHFLKFAFWTRIMYLKSFWFFSNVLLCW